MKSNHHNPAQERPENGTPARADQPAPKTRMQVFREYAHSFAVAIVLALFIRSFFVQAFKIPSGSMEPTLLIGDHILVNRFIYGFRIPFTRIKLLEFKEPQRGEIIVFKYPEDPSKDFIKRIIGIPGDTVEIREKKIYINNQLMEDQHGTHRDLVILPRDISPRDNYGPVRIPPQSYFVMGDNRDSSLDSRFWGFVGQKAVEGKALIIYWSWNREKTLPRLGRMGDVIR